MHEMTTTAIQLYMVVDAREGFSVWMTELMEWNQQMEYSFYLLAKLVL